MDQVVDHGPAAPCGFGFDSRNSYEIPDTLGDLQGPTSGVIRVGTNIGTSQNGYYDLSDSWLTRDLYAVTICDGSQEDIRCVLNKGRLLELWPHLDLPPRCRKLWEEKFPVLSMTGPRGEVSESELTHSELRSWKLHSELAKQLDAVVYEQWKPRLQNNLKRIAGTVKGFPHLENVQRWGQLIMNDDLDGMRQVMTGLDRQAIEMREVAPMQGLMDQETRLTILASIAR